MRPSVPALMISLGITYLVFSQVEIECGPQTILHLHHLLNSIKNEDSCLQRLILSFETCWNIHADTNELALLSREEIQNILTKDISPGESLPVQKMNTTYIKHEMFTTYVAPLLAKKYLKNRKILTTNKIFKDIKNHNNIPPKNEKNY